MGFGMTKTNNKRKKSFYIYIILFKESENEKCTQTMVLDTLAVSRCTWFQERVSNVYGTHFRFQIYIISRTKI